MSDNPEKVSFPFHLGGPGIMAADKQFSIYVSKTMDYLGKHQKMVKYRVNKYKELQEHYNIIHKPLETIIAGSKAEGLTSEYESDSDFMVVLPDVVCADNVIPFIHNRNTTLFQTDRHDSPAGYTKLKLVKFDTILSIVMKCSLFNNESEEKYMSSDLFVTRMAQRFLNSRYTGSIYLHEISGPSLPTSYQSGYSPEDKVMALRCVCPTLIHSFLTRPRPYNRPSRNALHDISLMDAHVVPVGHKGSNESHNEWRICFTKAEVYLVQRLNETETKLYILLKMVSKLFKFISKDITSYIMKNIVLWLVELNPVHFFTEDLLTFQLIQALKFLQKCVEVNILPSYMIPERNLFADRLSPVIDLQLNTLLSTLIQERGYLLLRFENLRDGMVILYREPDIAEEFRKRRDMVDKIRLLKNNIYYEKLATTGMSIEELNILMDTEGQAGKIFTPIFKIVCPDLMFLRRQGCSAKAVGKIIFERMVQLLS